MKITRYAVYDCCKVTVMYTRIQIIVRKLFNNLHQLNTPKMFHGDQCQDALVPPVLLERLGGFHVLILYIVLDKVKQSLPIYDNPGGRHLKCYKHRPLTYPSWGSIVLSQLNPMVLVRQRIVRSAYFLLPLDIDGDVQLYIHPRKVIFLGG